MYACPQLHRHDPQLNLLRPAVHRVCCHANATGSLRFELAFPVSMVTAVGAGNPLLLGRSLWLAGKMAGQLKPETLDQ